MADSEPDEGAHEGGPHLPRGRGKRDRNERIILLATVAGAIIGFLMLRKMGGSSGGSTGGAPAQLSTGQLGYSGGSVAGTGADSAALQGFGSMLANQNQMLAQLVSADGTGNNPANTSTSGTGTLPESVASPNVIYGQNAAGLQYLQDTTPGSPALGAVFQAQNDGTLIHLSPAQYAVLGSPKLTGFNDYGQPPNLDYVNSGNPGPLATK